MRLILAIICIGLAAGYYFLTGWYPEAEWIQGAWLRIGWPVLVGLVCLIIIVLPKGLVRGDSLARSWMALALGGCLLLVPLILAREVQSKADAHAREELVALREKLKLAQLRLQQEREAVVADRQERAKTDRFVQYEGRIPDETLQALRELDARMQAEVQSQADAYARALAVNPTRGPDDWVLFRTLDQLEVERAAHQALYQQTRAFTQFIESFEERYTAEINDLQLQPPADRIAIAELERILQMWERTRVYDLRILDVELLASTLNLLDTLRDAWGQWSYNPREKNITFTDPAREAAFHQALLRIKAIIAELDVIQDKVGNEE
ncbi:MAG TPA: hypothetical protein VK995_00970 [Oceanipulchritudo sp.]|nr:hypothetical protein [Oceanipulchritudo sp.]